MGDESLHLLFLLTGFHTSVDLTEPELGEGLFQYLVAILQILQVALLRLLDEREDDIHLASFPDLLTDAVVEGGHAGIENMGGPDGFATWWEFVDHTHVEVAIERHGEGTRDRGGGHHQYMGRVLTLAPEFGALGDTETVLFIDHHHAESGKLHRVLDDGMGAYEDMDRTVQESVKHFLTPFAFHDTREQGHAYGHVFQEAHDGLQMLFGEDLRGCHDTGLIAVVDGNKHRHQCHQCLTGADIALQQSVHLSSGTRVLADLADHPFLCFRQWERQVVVIEGVEHLS